jgi:G3E family GTPase
MAIPVTILSGYLGAGKTTLVNHLLRHAEGRRIAVLVNDFGSLPIDADLIEGSDGGVLNISGGCICCSFGDDVLATLRTITARKPDHILIETSGVALPAALAGAITFVAGAALDAIITVADVETVRRSSSDRFMGDTITRQLADADIILSNKCDLVSPADLAATTAWLAADYPRARHIQSTRGTVALAVCLGVGRTHLFASDLRLGARHLQTATTADFAVTGPVDAIRLARDLAAPDFGLVRAKGFVCDHTAGWRTVQVVGTRWSVEAAPAGVQPPGRLVCIAHGHPVNRSRVTDVLAIAAGAANRASVIATIE